MRALILSALMMFAAVDSARSAEPTKPGPDLTETRIERVIPLDEPLMGEAYFVHTFVLDLVGISTPPTWKKGNGTPVYRVVHTSEGPYEAAAVPVRLNEIATKGLMIGNSFWPLDRVQRVEVRSN